MATEDAVRGKVQRLLTNRFGRVEVDKENRFIVPFESAVTFIKVFDWTEDQTIVSLTCPMLVDVRITSELTHWIAVEGQRFFFGHAALNPNKDGKTGWVYFSHNLLGDDLDELELMEALRAVATTANHLDNELRDMFGGELFGPDE